MTQSPQPTSGGHRATALVVACVAGFISFLAALLLAGFAFEAAHVGFAPPHWQHVTVACAVLPLVGMAGLAIVRATPLQRSLLVCVGALGTWVLAVYEVVIADRVMSMPLSPSEAGR